MDFHTKGGKLQIQNGDIVTASDEQHDREMIERILYEPKGSFILNPILGVGLKSMLNGPVRSEEVKKQVRVNLKADGFRIFGLQLSGEAAERKIEVNARR